MASFDIRDINKWDDRAFRQLYETYYSSLLMYAQDITGDADEPADIVENVFAHLIESHNEFANVTVLKAYLYNAVRNQSINWLRRQKKANDYAARMARQYPEMVVRDGVEDFFTEEVWRQLIEEINRLPDRQRKIFTLAMNGKKNSEIAEALSISADTVKTQKRRAIARLQRKFGPAILLLLP